MDGQTDGQIDRVTYSRVYATKKVNASSGRIKSRLQVRVKVILKTRLFLFETKTKKSLFQKRPKSLPSQRL